MRLFRFKCYQFGGRSERWTYQWLSLGFLDDEYIDQEEEEEQQCGCGPFWSFPGRSTAQSCYWMNKWMNRWINEDENNSYWFQWIRNEFFFVGKFVGFSWLFGKEVILME